MSGAPSSRPVSSTSPGGSSCVTACHAASRRVADAVAAGPAGPRRGAGRPGRMRGRMRRSDRSRRTGPSRRCTSRRGSAFPLAAEVRGAAQLPVVGRHRRQGAGPGEAWCGGAVGVQRLHRCGDGHRRRRGRGQRRATAAGRVGNAGHIGHVVVEPDGRPCICGGKGCLETYCSGRRSRQETGRPPQRAPVAIVERTGLLMVGRALASRRRRCATCSLADHRRLGGARLRRAVLRRRPGRARQARQASVHQRLPGRCRRRSARARR